MDWRPKAVTALQPVDCWRLAGDHHWWGGGEDGGEGGDCHHHDDDDVNHR